LMCLDKAVVSMGGRNTQLEPSHTPRSPPLFSSPKSARPSRHPPAFPPSSRMYRSTAAPLSLQSLASCPPQARREIGIVSKTHPEQPAYAQMRTERTQRSFHNRQDQVTKRKTRCQSFPGESSPHNSCYARDHRFSKGSW